MQSAIIEHTSNIIAKARNLFRSEFQPMSEQTEYKERLIKNKILGEYKDEIVKMSTQQNEVGIISTLIESTKEDKSKVRAFSKYEQAVGQVSTEVSSALVSKTIEMNLAQSTKLGTIRASALRRLIKPTWHPPYKLYKVIAGHQGWVRGIAVSPCNSFFATGSVDRTLKFWDLASGELKMSLTGHVNSIRAVQFSKHHPYLFSCGEDKSIKCWDLEMNKVIRNYHGHLSGVYCLKIHDDLSVLVSGGRDAAARVWDVRVRKQIYTLSGHQHTVSSVLTQKNQPHVITGSHDSFVKLWDLGSGRCINTLTNHKKSIRALVQHPTEYTFATAAADNIKVWKCPQGQFLRNIAGHHSIIDSLAINAQGVLVSGGDDGTIKFWDWKSGYNFQSVVSQPQPGSIAAENAVFALAFDQSGTRLITGECDKTIKMWKQDQEATQEEYPIAEFKMDFQK